MKFKLDSTYNKDSGRFTLQRLNQDIPIITLTTTYYLDLDVLEGESVYYFPDTNKAEFKLQSNTIKNILRSFQSSTFFHQYTFGNSIFYICKGMIVDCDFNLLVVVCLKKSAALDYTLDNPVSYKDYVIYYSSLFYTSSNYTVLGRRFQKEIINPCLLKGMEVRVLTPDIIEKNTFARLFDLEYKSITQLNDFLVNRLKNIFTDEGGETFNLEVEKPVEIALEVPQLEEVPTEELSIEEEALLFWDFDSIDQVPVVEDTTVTTPLPSIILIDDTE